MDGIPPGPIVVKAIAYSERDGQGAALAEAQASAVIRAGETSTVALTLVAIVDRITATPSSLAMLVGEKAQVSAEALDATAAVIIGVPIEFTSDDRSVAEVDPSTGFVEAKGLGSMTLHARHAASGKEARIPVRVLRTRIVRVEVSATPPATVVGQPVQLAGVAIDDLGKPHPGKAFDWRVQDSSWGAVDATGRFTPAKVGLAQVIATERSSGVEGIGLVTVSEWVVLLNWASGADADLHVFDDHQTNHACFGRPAVPIGTLMADAIAGPGTEAFAGNTSVAGRYPVAVNYFRGQGGLTGEVTLLVAGKTPVVRPISLSVANGDGGYPITTPTASWARPFDVIVSAAGKIRSASSDTSIALGPPGSRAKP